MLRNALLCQPSLPSGAWSVIAVCAARSLGCVREAKRVTWRLHLIRKCRRASSSRRTHSCKPHTGCGREARALRARDLIKEGTSKPRAASPGKDASAWIHQSSPSDLRPLTAVPSAAPAVSATVSAAVVREATVPAVVPSVRAEGRGEGVGVVDGRAVEGKSVRVRERVRRAKIGEGAGPGRTRRLSKAVIGPAGCDGVRPRVEALRVRVGVVDAHGKRARAVGDARRPRLRRAALRKRLVRTRKEAEEAAHGDGQSRDSSARLARHCSCFSSSLFLQHSALDRAVVRCSRFGNGRRLGVW